MILEQPRGEVRLTDLTDEAVDPNDGTIVRLALDDLSLLANADAYGTTECLELCDSGGYSKTDNKSGVIIREGGNY